VTVEPGLRGRLLAAFRWHEGHADVWPWFADGALLRDVSAALAAPYAGAVDVVTAVESRGWLLAGTVARGLGCGVVPVRKDGGLLAGAYDAVVAAPDYRGTAHRLRMQRVLAPAARVLLVDDWVETGSQARAVRTLVERQGATWAGVATVVDQAGDATRAALAPYASLLSFADLGDADRPA
jgi:adenine phosphoribosyltransferase